MAKKQTLMVIDDDDIGVFSPQNAVKLPTDITNGKAPMTDTMLIPVDQIVPYGDKRDSDFSHDNIELNSAILESIKKVGVIEPVIVRPKNDEQFELLAGETRWLMAKEAGLTRIPARIHDYSDAEAHHIFSVTNLLRRNTTLKDKINGWWHYYLAAKESNQLDLLRNAVNDESMADSGSDRISYRQIMRYVKLHDLIPEWISSIEEKKITLLLAVDVAEFPQEIQRRLLNYPVNEKAIQQLKRVYRGKVEGVKWDDNLIDEIFGNELKKKKLPESSVMFNKSKKKIIMAVKSYLREEDYDRADDVLRSALELYYAKKK